MKENYSERENPMKYVGLGGVALTLTGLSIAYELNSSNDYGIAGVVLFGVAGYAALKKSFSVFAENTVKDIQDDPDATRK